MPRLVILLVFLGGIVPCRADDAPAPEDDIPSEDNLPPGVIKQEWRPLDPALAPKTVPPDRVLGVLQGFMDDPKIVGEALRMDPDLWPTLSPPAALVVADALMRRGKVRKAAQLYHQVLRQAPEESAWEQGARSGLGWIAVTAGDLDGIRQYFAKEGDPKASLPIARVLAALLDAADARPDAPTTLEHLSGDPTLGPGLREVARLGAGYAYFWAEEYDGAQRAFGAIREGRFADDAEYAAAWSRHVTGDEVEARAALLALAHQEGPDVKRRISNRLVRLEARAVLRGAGRRGVDVLHIATDDTWLAEMLDEDGPQLARAALRLLDRGGNVPPVAAEAQEGAAASHAGHERRRDVRAALGDGLRESTSAGAMAAVRSGLACLGIALAGIALAALWRRRLPAARR